MISIVADGDDDDDDDDDGDGMEMRREDIVQVVLQDHQF